ncbi:MAG: gliding motility-associated C-terminal domain-containing protein [Lewinella sp.]|uniref:T9SS type B sorting domain-containing protein n=1 Tax=Lewinella sp. TaxID=2004506 RepID=UPI003D6BE9CF
MRCYILLTLLFLSVVALQAQAPIITAGQETVLEGSTISVPVSVANFNDVVSIQFTLQWDPAVVTYQNTGDYGLPGMSEFNFGETDIANGRLTFVWFDGQVSGFTLPDDSVIFSVTFLAIGDLGDSSPVSFVNAPTPIQIGVINGVLIEEIDGTYIDGEVQIISETLQVETSTTSNTCFGESQGSITTNVEGGLPSYVFSWTGPDGFTSSDPNIDNLAAGDYALTITDQNGSIYEDDFVITEPSAIQVDNIQLQESNCDTPTGSIMLTVSGGMPDYLYDFGDGFSPDAVENQLAAGSYLVQIQDDSNCLIDTLITISESGAPEIVLEDDFSICPDDSATLTASTDPTFVYNWTLDGQPITPTTNEITVTEAGIYAVSATNTAGCTAVDQVTVSESMVPQVELGQDLELCANDETTLTASTMNNLTYSWTLDGQPFPQTTNEVTVNTTGVYAVTVTNENGCTATDQVTITEVAAPSIELGNDFGICPEEETTLSASEDQNLTYSWTFEGQPLTETTNEISINTVGTYAVSVTNAAGCTSTDQITIEADAVPVLELGEDVGICPGETATLSAGTDPTFVYNWTLDGQPITPTTNEITVTETGLYTVSASNDAGCTAMDEVIVSDAILPLLDLRPDTSICPKTTLILLANEDLITFNWTVDGVPTGTDAPELLVSNEGLVVLDALSEDGCALSDTVAISLIPFPTTVGPDTTIFSGQALTLFAEGGIAYSWMTNVELSCIDCPDPEVTLDETTTFLVDITSSEGCIVTETLTVNVEEAPEVLVDLVNFLSPNGDGKNDVLIFRGLENYRGNQLSIFNRWGDLIFSKPNYQIDGEYWDGTRNGQPLPPGIYYYVLNIDVASKPIKSALTIVVD